MARDLRDRVQQRAGANGNGGGPPAGTDVATREPKTLRQQIDRMLPEFELAMPKGFEAKQLIRDAMTLLSQNPKLAECQPETVLGGLMTFAQLGLRPGVMGQGWLLPFKKRAQINGTWRDVYQAQIVIGYQGYVELVHRSGSARKMTGRAVHRNDTFEVEYGLDERLVHRPAMGDRGPVVGYYSVIHLVGSDPLFWHMTRDEAIEWRNKFAMATRRDRQGNLLLDDDGNAQGSGPWFEMDNGPDGGTGFDQMAIKTCFLRAKRWAPKSTDRMLTAASEVDGGVRMGFGAVRPADDPAAYDDMLNVDHPTPQDGIVDGEVVDDGTGGEAGAGEGSAPAPASGRVQTDGQGRAVSAILRAGKVTSDGDRRVVLSHILDRAVPSQKELTFEEMSTVIDTLNTWQAGGTLIDDLAAITAGPAPAGDTKAAAGGKAGATRAAAQAAPAGDTPGAGAGDTAGAAGQEPGEAIPDPDADPKGWHEAQHPRRSQEGKVTRIAKLASDQCEWCE